MGLKLFTSDMFYKEGKGVSKDAPAKPPVLKFFEVYSTKFRHLSTCGLIFSGFAAVILLVTYLLSNEANIISIFTPSGLLGTIVTLLPLSLLAIPSASMSFISRNIVREKSYFIWHDFIRIMKENWLKSLIVGLINTVAGSAVITALFYYFDKLSAGWANYIPFFLSALVGMVILFASYYEFILIVSFELPIGTLLKYSAMIAIGNLPQTLVAFGVEAACVAAFYGLFKINFGSNGPNIGFWALLVGLILIIIIPMLFYLKAFVAWPMIEKMLQGNKADADAKETNDNNTEEIQSEDAADELDELDAPDDSEDSDNPEDLEDSDGEEELVFFEGRMVKKEDVDVNRL